jgi:hypothetical protein
VELADDRDVRRNARRGFVERREMVQVQHIRLPRATTLELARPRHDLELVFDIVEHREDPIRCAGPIFEGRMQWSAPGQGRETLGLAARERRIEINRPDITVEGARVSVLAKVAPRAGHERYGKPLLSQFSGKRTRCMRGPSARREQDCGDNPRLHHDVRRV